MNDLELLRDYASHGTEDSFRAVVETHAGLVQGAVLRLVGNPRGAEEVAQAVFVALAQKAGNLPKNTVLAGWLHTATRFAASHWLRAEQRRRQREQSAVPECVHAMNETDQVWEEIAPHLDTALASLGERDRHAVLLRFFEDHINPPAPAPAAWPAKPEPPPHRKMPVRQKTMWRSLPNERGSRSLLVEAHPNTINNVI